MHWRFRSCEVEHAGWHLLHSQLLGVCSAVCSQAGHATGERVDSAVMTGLLMWEVVCASAADGRTCPTGVCAGCHAVSMLHWQGRLRSHAAAGLDKHR